MDQEFGNHRPAELTSCRQQSTPAATDTRTVCRNPKNSTDPTNRPTGHKLHATCWKLRFAEFPNSWIRPTPTLESRRRGWRRKAPRRVLCSERSERERHLVEVLEQLCPDPPSWPRAEVVPTGSRAEYAKRRAGIKAADGGRLPALSCAGSRVVSGDSSDRPKER
jgi:hypothetical protein